MTDIGSGGRHSFRVPYSAFAFGSFCRTRARRLAVERRLERPPAPIDYIPDSLSPEQVSAVQEWLGVGRATARLLAALYAAPGAHRPMAALAAVVGARTTERSLMAHVRTLRAAMDTGALDHGEDGVRLTPVGVAECERALAEYRLARMEPVRGVG